MRDEIVSVVAGGWSVAKVDQKLIPGTIIGVNDSFFHLSKCDIGITMDRLFAEKRFEQMRLIGKPFHIRRAAMKNIVAKFPWLNVFDCDHESFFFSERPSLLNGTNSGLCALNLAYQMRPKQIHLFGFDMGRSPEGKKHWYPAYEWAPEGKEGTSKNKFDSWAKQMVSVAVQFKKADIEVFNVSDSSSIKAFPRQTTRNFNISRKDLVA